jgi:hypothetical protein
MPQFQEAEHDEEEEKKVVRVKKDTFFQASI